MRFLKSWRLACMLQALLLAFTAAAQQENDTTIITAADSVFHFDSINSQNTLPVTGRLIPDTTLQHLRSDDDFWYANTDFKKNKKEAAPQRLSLLQTLFSQPWFRKLVWAIIIGSFIIVMVLFLFKSNIQLMRKKPTAIGFEIPQNKDAPFSINYTAEIAKAVAATNYRLAVRYYFLQTLVLLSENGFITYKDDFTNSDYLDQLRPSPHFTTFKKLTRNFEFICYGNFSMSPETFALVETDFKTFKSSMGI